MNRSNFPLACEVCGTPVRLVGDVTKYYESAYGTVVKLHDENVTVCKALQDVCRQVEPEMTKLRQQRDEFRATLENLHNRVVEYAESGLIEAYVVDNEGLSDEVDCALDVLAKWPKG